MGFPNRQMGLSAVGWVFLVLIISGGVSVFAKLIPHYLEFQTFSAIIESLADEPRLINRGNGDIEALITKRLKMNSIRDFDLKERMKIKRGAEGVVIDVNYEVREPFFQNLSFVMTFSKEEILRR